MRSFKVFIQFQNVNIATKVDCYEARQSVYMNSQYLCKNIPSSMLGWDTGM